MDYGTDGQLPTPDLVNSTDPFFGFFDPSPDENVSIETPLEELSSFQPDYASDLGLQASVSATFEIDLEELDTNPEGLRVAESMENASWLDVFLVDFDHGSGAHLETVNDSLGNLSLSCSHHGTGHSPPDADQLWQSENCSEVESRDRSRLRNSNDDSEGQFIEIFGTETQLDSSVVMPSKLNEVDVSREGWPWDNALHALDLEQIQKEYCPQSGYYGIEEWLEHIVVPWRYAINEPLHCFDHEERFSAAFRHPKVSQNTPRISTLRKAVEADFWDLETLSRPSNQGPQALKSQKTPPWAWSPQSEVTLSVAGQPRKLNSAGTDHADVYKPSIDVGHAGEFNGRPRSRSSLPSISALCPVLSEPPVELPLSCFKVPEQTTSNSQASRKRGVSNMSTTGVAKRIRPRVQTTYSQTQAQVSGDMCSDLGSSNAGSAISDVSGSSHASWSGRKGRRKCRTKTVGGQKSNPNQPFQRTWCWTGFTEKSDWRRHEESQHAPQTEWVCMPEGPKSSDFEPPLCLFCRFPYPSEAHLRQNHEISSCLSRPLKDRKFDRKDHLVQHLFRWHGTAVANDAFLAGTISRWQRPIQAPGLERLWDCGFCEVRGMTWDQRYVHVAKHMKGGLNMCSWQQPEIYFCTRSGCIQNFPSYMSWRTHEETIHEHDLDMWSCEKQSTLNSAITCSQIFASQDAINQHLQADHKTLDTVRIIHIQCPGSDCPYDGEYKIFWCGFCRTIRNTHESQDKNDRFDHMEKNHFRPQGGINSWHAIGVQDRNLLTDTISAAIKRDEWESDEKSELCRYRLDTLRQWSITRQ